MPTDPEDLHLGAAEYERCVHLGQIALAVHFANDDLRVLFRSNDDLKGVRRIDRLPIKQKQRRRRRSIELLVYRLRS